MMGGVRMFVALVPPDEVVEDLEAFLEPRREAAPLRWAGPGQLHLTLAFLASVEDRRLDELGTPEAAALKGKAAVANAQLAYQLFLERFAGPRWDALAAAGARVQRAMEILDDDAPEHLLAAGRLRVAHAQASLEELGAQADPPLTKDAVAGRIRRLLALADKRAAEIGIPNTEAAGSSDSLLG